MTVVLNRRNEGWQLSQLQLGLNEIASALVLSKRCGSLFSRQTDAAVFTLLQEQCGSKVLAVPQWLQDFKLPRSTKIYGSRMRVMFGPDLMKDVAIESLEGLLAVVVLCSRYTESAESVLTIVEGFLTAAYYSKCIDPGTLKDAQASVYRAWEPLLRSWVQAILSSDAESPQAIQTKLYLATLAQEGASTKLTSPKVRSRASNTDLLKDMLGADEASKVAHWGTEIQNRRGRKVRQRVFETMSAGTASIALAAAANRADISLECITYRNGVERRKLLPATTDFPTEYLVRLWLCKPPFEIYKSFHHFTAETDISAEEASAHFGRNVVFGGEKEIALIVAQELDYWTNNDADVEIHILPLWALGVKTGASMQWAVRPLKKSDEDLPVQFSPHLYFQLNHLEQQVLSGNHVSRLASSLKTREPHMKAIARTIAHVIDTEYLFAEYVDCPENDHYYHAAEFVLIAMTVGCLQSLTILPQNNVAFALNLGALTIRGSNRTSVRSGELRTLISNALGYGIGHTVLLWAAALLWGGASYESQGYNMMKDRVIGVVAPQCTVILDYIKDPTTLAKLGLDAKIMSVHSGAVPVLARDPNSGFIMAEASRQRSRANVSNVDCSGNVGNYSPGDVVGFPAGGLVITFEADITGPAVSSSFIGWYEGDLVFELDPLRVFENLLLHRDGAAAGNAAIARGTPRGIRYLDFTELMKYADYNVEDGTAVFCARDDLNWVVACAGCAELGTAAIQIGQLDLGDTDAATATDHTIIHLRL